MREYEESLSEYCGQGANLSRVKCGTKVSHVFREDKVSSIGYLGDYGSANSPLGYFCVFGKAKWCLNNVAVLPSAWNERKKWGWESENYKELMEILNIESLSLIHI